MYTRRTRGEMCARHAAVVEEAAAGASPARRESLLLLYRRSLEHQVRVFDAAWALEGRWPGGRDAYALRAVRAAAGSRPNDTSPGAKPPVS